MEQEEVVFLEEVQPVDPGSMLACGDKDLFTEKDPTNFQLKAAINASTQGNRGVPTQSP